MLIERINFIQKRREKRKKAFKLSAVFFLFREHGRWGACGTGADCVKKKKKEKISQVWSKTDSSHRKKRWNFKKIHNPPSTDSSLLHTPTHTVFAGWGDNNGSWRSRDRRLQTLTALCYVMNVWLPPHLPTSHQYGATDFGLRHLMFSIWTQQQRQNDGETALSRRSRAQEK